MPGTYHQTMYPLALTLLLVGCSGRTVPAAPTGPAPDHFVLEDVRLPGGQAIAIEIAAGRIVGVDTPASPSVPVVDGHGHYVVPGIIDSHVHLDYLPVAPEHAQGGVVAAVDLASPLAFVARPQPLRLLGAGPMVTPVGGYPTLSWGGPTYGIECATPEQARAAVRTVRAGGAGIVKVPVSPTDGLTDPLLIAAVDEAHRLGMPVVAHALTDADAARARAAGVDVLAHTPTQTLSEDTVQAWSDGTVISTLRAFGGSSAAVDNLRRLRAAGATVLYGTDLGNTSTPGVDAGELDLLEAAGMDAPAILEAMTTAPAGLWGWDDLGRIAVDKAASLLLVPTDPAVDPSALVGPATVYIDGVRVSP